MTTTDQTCPGEVTAKRKPSRLTTGQLLKLAGWLTNTVEEDPNVFASSDRATIAGWASKHLGTEVSWATIAEVARNCGIRLDPKRASKPSRDSRVSSLAAEMVLHLEPAATANVSCTLPAETVHAWFAVAKGLA